MHIDILYDFVQLHITVLFYYRLTKVFVITKFNYNVYLHSLYVVLVHTLLVIIEFCALNVAHTFPYSYALGLLSNKI